MILIRPCIADMCEFLTISKKTSTFAMYPQYLKGKNVINYPRVPLRSFHCAKFLKKILEWIQSYEGAQFLGPNWSICLAQIFFWKNY